MLQLKKIWKNRRSSLRLPFGLFRVHGTSMAPTLPVGRVLIARQWFWRLRPNEVVVFHHDGVDKIKRIQKIAADRIFVVGDNEPASTDSRSFGWLPKATVIAKVDKY